MQTQPSTSRLLTLRRWTTVFQRMDRAIARWGRWLGTEQPTWQRQILHLLSVYTVLLLLGSLRIPFLPLVALFFAYLGIWCVGRAWVANEKARELISRGIVLAEPDELPDLRALALLSALMLLPLFPIVFQQLQLHFGLFHTQEEVSLLGWCWFAFDSFCKSILDWSEIYNVHMTTVTTTSTWGKHAVFLERITLDLLLVQALFRLWSIRTQIQEGLAALPHQTDTMVRLGKRSLRPLRQTLRLSLRRQEYPLAIQTIHALGQLPGPKSRHLLQQALQHKESTIRLAALQALSLDSHSASVDALMKTMETALQHQDTKLFQHAQTALLRQDSPQPLSLWLKGIHSNDSVIQQESNHALETLKDTRAIPELLSVLEHGTLPQKEQAARVLGSLGAQSATPLLVTILHNSRGKSKLQSLRQSALLAAGKLRIHETQEHWYQSLKEEPELREASIRAMGYSGAKDTRMSNALVDALLEKDYPKKRLASTRAAAVFSLGQLADPNSRWALEQALKDEQVPSVQTAILEALTHFPGVEPLTTIHQSTLEQDLQLQALNVLRHFAQRQNLSPPLQHYWTQEVFPSLQQLCLSNDTSLHTKMEAIRCMGEHQDREHSKFLCTLLQTEQPLAMTEALLHSLGEQGYREHFEVVLSFLSHYRPVRLQQAATTALGKLEDLRSIPYLLKQLDEDETSLRVCTAEALGHLGSNEALSPLRKAMNDRSPSVRVAAIQATERIAFAQHSTSATCTSLERRLSDPSTKVLTAAAHAIGALEHPNAEALLRKLWDANIPQLKHACVIGLSHRNHSSLQSLWETFLSQTTSILTLHEAHQNWMKHSPTHQPSPVESMFPQLLFPQR